MKFYKLLHKALTTDNIDEKETLCHQAMEYCNIDSKIEDDNTPIEIFKSPSYVSICNIVSFRELPRRRDFTNDKGLATLLHSITHIEYSAIDLAIDAVYRFRDMPISYKIDWLEVAFDEIRHFRMLNGILKETGFKYGDFPVHSSLFDISMATAGDILERMAVIPRHYEATGLDVNPKIIEKLRRIKTNPKIEATINALEVIYNEEISHVQKGDKWFKYICNQRDIDIHETFFEILKKYRLLNPRDINVEARLKAGFECRDITRLGAKKCP